MRRGWTRAFCASALVCCGLLLTTACNDPVLDLLSLTGDGRSGTAKNSGSSSPTETEPPPPPNHRPVADAGEDATVAAPGEALLDGLGSSDPDGGPLYYSWTLLSKPHMSGAALSSAASPAPSVTLDRDGEYRFRLVVSDGLLSSDPAEVTVTLSFPTGSLLNLFTVGFAYSPPAMDENGLMYAGDGEGFLYAVDMASTESYGSIMVGPPDNSATVWKTDLGSPVASAPALAPDGTVYAVSFDGFLRAVNPRGDVKWSFDLGGGGTTFFWASSPALGGDGTLYAGSMDHHLYAVTPQGTQAWRFDAGGPIATTPAVGNDGTVYLAAGGKLHALSAGGEPQWEFPTPTASASLAAPAIGGDGTVYVNAGKILHAVSSGGRERWSFDIGSELGELCPAVVGPDETVYTASRYKVFALDGQTGATLWARGFSWGDSCVFSTPALDSRGVLYVPGFRYLHAFGPDGSELWFVSTFGRLAFQVPIVTDHAIHLATESGIRTFKNDAPGMADAPWPRFKRDLRGTSRAAEEEGQQGATDSGGGCFLSTLGEGPHRRR